MLYRSQLHYDIPIKELPWTDFEKIKYSERDLIAYFNDYNLIQDDDYVVQTPPQKYFINLSVKASLSSNSLVVNRNKDVITPIEFQTKSGFRVRVEFELALPFKKRQWSILAEPTYQQYSDDTQYKRWYSEEYAYMSVHYKSVEIPLGIRHYFHLGANSKIYFSALFILNTPIGSTFKDEFSNYNDYSTKDLTANTNFGFNCGLRYKNKYSIEVFIQTEEDFFLSSALFLAAKSQIPHY